MILLPTRRRLERRRNALYRYLQTNLHHVSYHEVEDIMRRIHGLNLRLKTYFIRENYHEPAEIFEDEDTLETQDPTFVQIEEALGEVEI